MRLSARGTRDLDDGETDVGDPDLAAALRRQGRRIHVQAVVIAVLALPVLFLP